MMLYSTLFFGYVASAGMRGGAQMDISAHEILKEEAYGQKDDKRQTDLANIMLNKQNEVAATCSGEDLDDAITVGGAIRHPDCTGDQPSGILCVVTCNLATHTVASNGSATCTDGTWEITSAPGCAERPEVYDVDTCLRQISKAVGLKIDDILIRTSAFKSGWCAYINDEKLYNDQMTMDIHKRLIKTAADHLKPYMTQKEDAEDTAKVTVTNPLEWKKAVSNLVATYLAAAKK